MCFASLEASAIRRGTLDIEGRQALLLQAFPYHVYIDGKENQMTGIDGQWNQ
jgi:hypothetical protein